jgi:lysyl-tRNA synthetase class II
MKTDTTTAKFATLRKAVHEAHKYGAPHTYEAVRQHLTLTGSYTHDITHDRQLTITRQDSGGWKLSVQVSGRVVPVRQMPKLMFELMAQPQVG